MPPASGSRAAVGRGGYVARVPERRAGLEQQQSADHARDRIGTGPWRNANDVVVANTLAELHARTGDAALFLNETGQRINGQWTGSPSPVEHDILTGSNATEHWRAGLTCGDWTSASDALAAQVGHSDGLGPDQSTAGALASWNSAHANRTAPTRHRAAAPAESTASRGTRAPGTLTLSPYRTGLSCGPKSGRIGLRSVDAGAREQRGQRYRTAGRHRHCRRWHLRVSIAACSCPRRARNRTLWIDGAKVAAAI